ncbi:hypothetical protein ABAC402_08960 [Asticcacaulis sp. AC402]|nr:hypothetical protein ABAC402_08960 [Asticcacaulis sp. AC402]
MAAFEDHVTRQMCLAGCFEQLVRPIFQQSRPIAKIGDMVLKDRLRWVNTQVK